MSTTNLFVTVLAWMLFSSVGALSAERDPNVLHVLSSNASHPAISKLIPLFEKQFQAIVRVDYANNPILKPQIEAGTEFDVAIIEPKMLQELAQRGLVSENSIVALAAIGMALVSKEGAPSVDIGSVESFKKVLLSAKSIAYTADGHSGAVFLSTLERLGLTEQMKPKLVPVVGRLSTLAVAEGSAQYTAFPLAGSVPGVQLAGKFPDAVQTYIGISAAKSSRPDGPVLRDRFLEYLQSKSAWSLFEAMGFTPAPPRQK